MRRYRHQLKRYTLVAATIHLIFNPLVAGANPFGPSVVSGQAEISRPNAASVHVTNAPGAIINWQGFSIGANEITRFVQQSASSAVLNRVVGPDISSIQGQLLSNGRVFLINPAGIMIGPSAMIDAAGFVGSTLNMLDSDFLAGKLQFQGNDASGAIINQGWVRTSYGGQVVLVAPSVENSGLIQTPGGELILAAGKSLTIGSLEHEGVRFEIQAPTDSVVNVGRLLADGGAVGVFAGTLKHSGEIRANALVRDEGGKIVLKATNDIQLAANSITSANGENGGTVVVESTAGHSRVAGAITVVGSGGIGGKIAVMGDRVTATDGATLDASGDLGGGEILLGGDYQGANPAISNSSETFVGTSANLRADATLSGDGGRIIVWSDDKTQYYGNVSAQAGAVAGNGGFAEISGKKNLVFAGGVNLGATNGRMGSLLIDPLDLYVFSGGGLNSTIVDENTDFPGNAATVSPATLSSITGNVTLLASRYMRISDAITLTTPGQSLTAQVGTWTPPALPDPIALDTNTPNRLDIAADITTAVGAITLNAPSIQSVVTSAIASGGGAIMLNTTEATQASQLSLDAGTGAVTATAGTFLQLNTITGGSFIATAPSSINIGGLITTGGGVASLNSSGSSVNIGGATSSGGAVTISGSNVNGGTIDTTGKVSLTASSSSVFATVNNSSGLTASAPFSVFINSATDINIDTVTAGTNGTASLTTSNGTIRATSDASKVTGRDVTLSTGLLTGGGIVGATQPLNVDVQRIFNFDPNGTFSVQLTGTGPNQLNSNIGVAPTGQSFSGMLTKSGGGLTLNAAADDTTVTLSNLAITNDFDQRVGFLNPSISFRVPNGALVATSVTVPTGDTVSTVSEPNGIPLPVSIRSQGDLTLNAYTRAPGGLTKQTTIRSDSGAVTLSAVDAGKDDVSVSSSLGTTINSLSTSGNVTINSGFVQALLDSAGLEITSGGALSINSFGDIGSSGFANPLDLAASSISLRTFNAGTSIGGASGPVVANTQTLTINTPGNFNVSTGALALSNLTVTANAFGVGAGGLAQVRTEVGGASDKTYSFASDGTDFSLAIGAVPVTQFNGGTFNFNASSGNINLIGNSNFGAGIVELTSNGDIDTAGASIDAANVTLQATNNVNTGSGNITATGVDGNITLKANTQISAGALNAAGSIELDRLFSIGPAVSLGTIGNITAPQSISINGSSVTVGAINGAGDVTINANNGGLLSLGGAVSTSGNSIALTSSDAATPLSFTAISAGASGTVNLDSSSRIEQTGGPGITAGTVILKSGDAIIQAGGDGRLDINGSTSLTVDSATDARIDANGSTLASLNVTRRASPTVAPFQLSNLGGGQTVALIPSTNTLLTVNSPLSALDFTLTNLDATNLVLDGPGVVTSGGLVDINTGGGFDSTTGGITTGGGNVLIGVSGGVATLGPIATSNGGIGVSTFCASCNININGTLSAGTGAISLLASSGNIAGSATISSGTSVTVATSDGEIGMGGTSPVPLSITSPMVNLSATRGGTATGNQGSAFATLTGTALLTLNADRGFNVSSSTPFSFLSVTSKGTGAGALALTAPGQTYTFDRPATDLFGASVTGTAFEIVSVNAPGATATFAASDGTLLVRGAPGTPNKITVSDLTLNSTNGGDISLQGNAPNPLLLSNTNQMFNASGGALADLLIRGTVTLSSANNQTLTASGNISVNADALGGGIVTFTAPNQIFTTNGGGSKMEFLGGAAADEKIIVAASNSQTINSTSSSIDSFKLKGGAGADASVTLSHSGPGVQEFQVSNGTVTVEGGSGSNAYAKIEETGVNQQQLCRDLPSFFCGGGINTLSILGGAGNGAFAQITAAGAQVARVNSATNIKAGSGDGAYALMQAGTTQTFFQAGNLTVEGGTNAATTAKGELLATGTQSISANNVVVKAGAGSNSLAQITTAGNQFISGSGLTLTASGTEATPVAGGAAIIEGNSQSFNFGNVTLSGGAGAGAGTESDAILRNLSGGQTIFAGTTTLNGGHQFSTTGILNLGTGAQSVSGNSGITLSSDLNGHADAFTLIQNTPATLQTISAGNGLVRLNNQGGGTVGITSAGEQKVTAQAIEVLTNATTEPGPGIATISASGSQWLRTTDGTASGFGSMRVAALGAGAASVESGSSQLIELDYPDQMQFVRDGTLTIGDVNATGTSRIKAVDQTLFAKSVLIQSGLDNSLSELKSSNNQIITTLNGGIQVFGGSGANTLAQIDPVIQSILTNGGIDVQGGTGVNSIAQILAGSGAIANGQTILTTSGNIALTAGSAAGASALITNLGSSSFVGAFGDIILTPGTLPGADAIISVGGGPGVLTLLCGGSCVLPAIGPTPTAGILANQGAGALTTLTPIDATATLIALLQDQSATITDAAPGATADDGGDTTTDIRKLPMCQ